MYIVTVYSVHVKLWGFPPEGNTNRMLNDVNVNYMYKHQILLFFPQVKPDGPHRAVRNTELCAMYTYVYSKLMLAKITSQSSHGSTE